jgi:aryl-alcohol dehydrogenase-like predicted oxidoreductase
MEKISRRGAETQGGGRDDVAPLRANFREPVEFGRTGLSVGRLGIGASYKAPANAIEKAFFEYGANLMYWGSIRRSGMREAVRNIAPANREKLVVTLQSYDRTGPLMRVFVERGLRGLGVDYADLLILGWFNSLPPRRILDAAAELVRQGKVRFLAMSSHNRKLHGEIADRADDLPIDALMFRYNAAHRGAESEIFPHLERPARPGTIGYTATRWGQLLDQKRMPAGERPLTASECYRFVLSSNHVDVCLAGPSDADQMDQALRALDDGPLSDDDLARARRIGDHVRGKG